MISEKTGPQLFVERILKLYLELPETSSRASRTDRRLAEEFYEK